MLAGGVLVAIGFWLKTALSEDFLRGVTFNEILAVFDKDQGEWLTARMVIMRLKPFMLDEPTPIEIAKMGNVLVSFVEHDALVTKTGYEYRSQFIGEEIYNVLPAYEQALAKYVYAYQNSPKWRKPRAAQ